MQNRLVAHVRSWFQLNAAALLPPLADWATSTQRSRVGYVHNHKREAEIFLVFVDSMRDVVCEGLSLNAVLDALTRAGLLVTPKKGKQWLQRMPGVPRGSAGSRMAFYAIRTSILFNE